MAAKGGIETSIEPGLVARAVRGLKYAFTGEGDWFGPGQPLTPTAPEAVQGRQFQFPISTNTVNSTKTDGISFGQLRQFADACDIVRLLIETRKDQVCGLGWTIKPVDKGEAKPARGAKPAVVKDARIADLTAFLRAPDKEHTWSEWLRLLLEDMFVLDAPTLYIQRTNGGDLYALRPIDGGTVKRIIDTHGWTPMAPLPAYQQILQGTVALSYTREEMIYRPRNPRTNRIYGYGPVEQTIVTAKQWLLRQASNLEYYETGNMPEGFLTGAAGWTPEQLAMFQGILDSMLSGNLAERRKVRVVPDGSKYTPGKEPALKNDFDEWLARVACFAFSYPPTPFIKQMNRSTSDNAKQSADEEGVQPITRWVKELMDEVIQQRMGMPDLEFVFEDKEAQDPLERAQIDQIYIASGVLKPDEVRAEMGLEPLPEPDPVAPAKLGPDGKPLPPEPTAPKADDPTPDPAQKLAKMGADGGREQNNRKPLGWLGSRKPGDSADAEPATDTPTDAAPDANPQATPAEQAEAEIKLAREIEAALELAADTVAEQVAASESRGLLTLDAQAMADQIDVTPLTQAAEQLQASITEQATAGADNAMVELSIGGEDMTSLVNTRAVEWAERRAADLIKSDGTGGELLDATRNLIRSTIEQAVEEGWSAQQLAKELRGSYAFSADRAVTIARTELQMAYANGAMQGYIASGVVKRKQWILDPDPCPVCIANAGQGEIPLLQAFQGGSMTAPAHPRCRCTVVPITED